MELNTMKFTIPEKIKIFNQTIRIEFVKELSVSEISADGAATFSKNLIELDEEICQDMLHAAYFHEVTHHILFNLAEPKLNTDECFVQSLSCLLHQYVKTVQFQKNNPDIPHSFTIFGQDIKVLYVEAIADHEEAVCWCAPGSNEILLLQNHENIVIDRIMGAFYTQLIYQILHFMGHKLSKNGHQFQYRFALAFHQIIEG